MWRRWPSASLHAYQNDAHERRAREILARYLPAEVIAISSEVCPEIREYERTSTTVANAYVPPLMESYLRRLEDGLKALGSTCPLPLIMSLGGITTVDTARRFPIRLVELARRAARSSRRSSPRRTASRARWPSTWAAPPPRSR